MIKISIFILFQFIIMVLVLTSCFKDDKMILPHDRGDVQTDTIAMTDSYKYQIYFSLDSSRVVRSNSKTDSDLGFECTQDGWHILLNTGTFMKIADLGIVEFGLKQDTVGKKFYFDKSDGNPDSTAIGQWFNVSGDDTVSNNHVYAIDRGLDELGNSLGMYQVIFDSLSAGSFYFRYAFLSGGTIKSGIVQRDPVVSYKWFSLAQNVVKDLEPPFKQYDLLFTQYTTLLFTDEGIPYPYLVTGVFLNRMSVAVAIDTLHVFSSITRDITMDMTFSTSMDAIGYDWKYYDFDSGVYTIRPNINYIIRGRDGYFYKLRFIGFYDKNGSKGYPVIEYQLL